MIYSISVKQIQLDYDAYLVYTIKIKTNNLRKRKIKKVKKEKIKITDMRIRFDKKI